MSSKRSLVVAFLVIFTTLAAAVLLVATQSTATEKPTAPPSTAPSTQHNPQAATPVTIVSTRYVRPRRVVRTTLRFTPVAHPSPNYVRHVILPYEAARAGASLGHLLSRVNCESTFRWWATNGQYMGIGQFASSTFYRGVLTLGSRVVTLVRSRVRVRRIVRVRRYSNGRVERKRRWRIHQHVITVYRGRLNATYPDAWTEARIMSQAMVGRSAVHDSEWECR